MMRSVGLLSIVVMLSACDLFDRKDRCDGIESEFIAGFEVTGFAVATNGRGYLSGIARFGDCFGTAEPRFFKVDTEAQTAEPIPVDFLPGKILVAPDGERALVMGYKIPFQGVRGGVAEGAVLVEGTTMTTENLGGGAFDIQPARDGWIASTGGGSWHVSFEGAQTLLASTTSYCGAEALSHRVICMGSDVKVLDSSGAIVDSISFDSEPRSVAAAGNTVVVVHGTAATSIVSGAFGQTLSPQGLLGEAWVSPDEESALVQSTYGTQWLKLLDGSTESTGDNVYAFDAAFPTDGLLGLIAYRDYGFVVVDLLSGDVRGEGSPNDTAGIENLGGRVFVLAGGKNFQVFRPGDVVPNAFLKLEVVSPGELTTRIATWDLVVE